MSFFKSSKKLKQKEEIDALILEKDDLRKSEEKSKQLAQEAEGKAVTLEQTIKELKAENKNLKSKLHTEEPYEKIFNERQALKDENNDKSLKIEELEKDHQKFDQEITTYRKEMAELQKELERKKQEHDSLMTEIETEKTKIKELAEEKEELINRIEELEKRNIGFEDEFSVLKDEFKTLKAERDEISQQITDAKQKESKQNMMYIEELRKELAENKTRIETLLLESEALKSENESLFRANDSKKEEMMEIQKEVGGIKTELQLEKLRYQKLKKEWDEEKKKTEFVLVSKRKSKHKNAMESFKEENDSEEEHVLNVVEAAKIERETLKTRELELKRRVSQLETDKQELFRSGTNLFAENKTLKAKYDTVVGERTTLLQVEAALKRRVRSQEEEIKDLKKTVDDLYYQNMSIRTNDETEHKQKAYVVVMGNEMIKQLEREKSALHRRVKYLERENNEIESRVIELERRSKELNDYTSMHDVKKSSYTAPLTRRDSFRHGDRDRGNVSYRDRETQSGRNRELQTNREDRHSGRDQERLTDRELDRRIKRLIDDRPPSGKVYHEYRERSRPTTLLPSKSPDYYKSNVPPFNYASSRQPSMGIGSVRSQHSHGSHVSLPHIGSGSKLPSPKTPRGNDSRADSPPLVKK